MNHAECNSALVLLKVELRLNLGSAGCRMVPMKGSPGDRGSSQHGNNHTFKNFPLNFYFNVKGTKRHVTYFESLNFQNVSVEYHCPIL